NLGFVAAAARAAGVPVLYYITPQVWASRPGRIDALKKHVARAAVIFPFEETLLRAHGVDATFVGHPLVEAATALPDRAEARRTLGIDATRPVLALFPGSRPQEIARHVGPFVETARELEARIPGLQVVVSHAPSVTIDPSSVPYRLVRAPSLTLLRAADAALCKSGTTTLEAAVARCPLVLAYRMGKLDYAIAKRLVRIPDIGLVNIVAERRVVPEFVQDAFVPSRVADALAPLLDPFSAERAQMLDDLAAVRAKLGEPGAAGRVAAMAMELAAESR
ncbi:MAG: lipid-A-disaccharide synthase, partial [Gemmatimonadaceae bacterium]|nr:lipid-A-disaccharide synthase [Gemmatimonadaceae bacterium]